MKKAVVSALAVVVAAGLLLAGYFLWYRRNGQGRFSSEPDRESITFILGEDIGWDNPYYGRAAGYFSRDPAAGTDCVVVTCRSLAAVGDYLTGHPPLNRRPWGVINLVAHGNPWSGLAVPTVPGGRRTTVETILSALRRGELRPLPDHLADLHTEIRIYGCALGRNRALLAMLGRAFGGDDSIRPVVRAARMFTLYSGDADGGNRQYLAEFWPVFHKPSSAPSPGELAGQLAERYPDAEINWSEALRRTDQRSPGDVFHRVFRIPVRWTVVYPDGESLWLPKDKEEQEEWLAGQAELTPYLDQAGIPFDCCDWRFRRIDYTGAAGATDPAIEATGVCEVVCVLKSLAVANPDDPDDRRPFSPPVTDSRYYAVEAPVHSLPWITGLFRGH